MGTPGRGKNVGHEEQDDLLFERKGSLSFKLLAGGDEADSS